MPCAERCSVEVTGWRGNQSRLLPGTLKVGRSATTLCWNHSTDDSSDSSRSKPSSLWKRAGSKKGQNGDFADMMNWRMLRWGDDPGSSRWAQCGHKALTRGRQEVRDREDDGSRVREKKVWIHCATRKVPQMSYLKVFRTFWISELWRRDYWPVTEHSINNNVNYR